jgi:hypothetical protein
MKTSHPDFSFLPDLLPDQTLYSWTGMFHLLSGAALPSITCKALFGSPDAGRHFHIPSHLDSFCERTQHVLGSVEEVVSTATTIPFYTQFRPRRIAAEVMEKVRAPQNAGIAQTLGIYTIGQHSFPSGKACAECIREDSREYGFGYWHRAHQLPCTLVCHKHKTMLSGVAVDHQLRRHAKFISPPLEQDDQAHQVAIRVRTNEHEILDRLAQIAMSIASFKQPLDWDRNHLGRTFLKAVRERKVWFGSSILDPNKLELDFCRHYSEVMEIGELAPAIQKRGIYTVWCLIEGVERPVHPEDWVIAIEWIFGSWQAFAEQYALQSMANT